MTVSDPTAPLRERFAFEPPAAYRELLAAGCFDPHRERHLQFSDCHWLSPARAAAWVFHPDQLPGLVPLAHTEHHDLWCWYPALNDGGPAPVVFCPDEDEVAFVIKEVGDVTTNAIFPEDAVASAVVVPAAASSRNRSSSSGWRYVRGRRRLITRFCWTGHMRGG